MIRIGLCIHQHGWLRVFAPAECGRPTPLDGSLSVSGEQNPQDGCEALLGRQFDHHALAGFRCW
jgi:hypothetical protein